MGPDPEEMKLEARKQFLTLGNLKLKKGRNKVTSDGDLASYLLQGKQGKSNLCKWATCTTTSEVAGHADSCTCKIPVEEQKSEIARTPSVQRQDRSF